jgi:uncharacterized glyoxalase superfamily protein PhnB
MTGKLNAFGIVVGDLARSVRFYRSLGVTFPADAEHSDHGHAEAILDGGVRLMLDTEETMRSFDPGWRRPSGSPATSLAFQCDRPAQLDALYVRAIEAGGVAHKEPWDAFWGQRYAQLRDPDGNGVDLYANMETAP